MKGHLRVCVAPATVTSKQRVSAQFVAQFSGTLRRFKQTAAFRAIYRKYFHGASGP
jgi:hypothetical protein